MGDLPTEPYRGRGEQGTESTSSSMEDVSDRRDSRGGAWPQERVRTRGEPHGSSQPLSTVWAVFWRGEGEKRRSKKGDNG